MSSSMIISEHEEMNPTRRSTMEDCSVCLRPGTWGCKDSTLALLGVYDGHGGRDIVDFLEDALSENLAKELNNADAADIPTRIERAFLLTDVQSRMAGLMTSGATVATCLIKKDPESNSATIHAANVGDARAVLSCMGKENNRRAVRLTHDHRADDPVEVARIEAAGGFVLNKRVLGILAVARSLGDHGLKEYVIGRPYISKTEVEDVEGEFVIVACDGLWDVMTDQEAVDMVRKLISSQPQKMEIDQLTGERVETDQKETAARTLVDEALKRGSTDNVTAVVAWF